MLHLRIVQSHSRILPFVLFHTYTYTDTLIRSLIHSLVHSFAFTIQFFLIVFFSCFLHIRIDILAHSGKVVLVALFMRALQKE